MGSGRWVARNGGKKWVARDGWWVVVDDGG